MNVFLSGAKPKPFIIYLFIYHVVMKQNQRSNDDLVITFKPEATPEEEQRFLIELAHAIVAIARHVVDTQEEQVDKDNGEQVETIEF